MFEQRLRAFEGICFKRAQGRSIKIKNRTSLRSSAMCLRADKDQPKLFTCNVTLDLMLAALFLWIMLFLANLSSIV